MSDINVIINDSVNNISVIVDDSSPNLQQFYSTINNLNLLYSLSSKLIETSFEMDTLQETLTSKWTETSTELNTIQETLTAGWQETYNFNSVGIVDGGNF